ncbi:MAG: penicillin-binding protein 2 [Actinobacteria bacterium]|nr:penicillin-binding protein 2 [Actinomycetota bacterium]
MIPASRRRLVVMYVVVAALLIALGGRLWFLQVMNRAAYRTAAAADQTRTITVPPVRGGILDDVGTSLVGNRTSLVISVDRMLLSQQADGGVAELHRLAGLIGMKYRHLQRKLRVCGPKVAQPCWQGSPYQPIPVMQNAPNSIALQIMESQRQFPGVTAEVQPVTQYDHQVATSAAQELGYLQPVTPQEMKQLRLPETGFSGVDLVGQSGLEASYDAQLRGSPGRKLVRVDANGNVTGTVSENPAKSGDTLVTSLNSRLQADTSRALTQAISKAQSEGNRGATTGAAVVMTTTGRVLAMASYPSYNPAVWTKGINQSQFRDLFGSSHGEPVLNRATQGEYGPGSTWKVTSAAAAMMHGYGGTGPYQCPGSVNIAGHTFNNWTTSNLGPMSIHQALVMSCDTVFYQLAYQMYLHDRPRANVTVNAHPPAQLMQKMEVAWGFGHRTGVDLPEENTGTVPTRQWLYDYWAQFKHYWCKTGKRSGTYLQQVAYDNCRTGYQWTPGQAAIAAIGQGYVTVTPLQLARAYAALANGGRLYSPRLGEALISPSGQVVKRIRPPVTGHLPVSRYVLDYIKSSLEGVVTQGTAAGAFSGFPLSKVQIAAKTGTAEVFGGQATSVFASFAPASHPKYVVVVMVPKSGEGADVSAPAARQIWDSIYGLEGHQAAFPGGQAPAKLPKISGSGAITPPAGYATHPPRRKPGKHATPAPTASTGTTGATGTTGTTGTGTTGTNG